MPKAVITMPADAELLYSGRLKWIADQHERSEKIYRDCIERLPSLVDRVQHAEHGVRHAQLQDLVACAVNARTQWERIEALIEAAAEVTCGPCINQDTGS